MKSKPFFFKVLAIGLCAASLSSIAAQPLRPTKLLGEPAMPEAATHTVVIMPSTKHVHVVSGETVKFIISDKQYGWHFDGPEGQFKLAQVLPSGTLDHDVSGYVERNPLYK